MSKAIAVIAAVFIAFCVLLLTILVHDFFEPFALWSATRAIVSIAIGLLFAVLAGRHSYFATLARVQKFAPQNETLSKTQQPR